MKKKMFTRVLICFIISFFGLVIFFQGGKVIYAEDRYNGTANGRSVTDGSIPIDGGNPYCSCGKEVGSGSHWCCWNYAANVYRTIWGQTFDRTNMNNNMLRNVSADGRTMTVEHLRQFFSQTKAGANFRMDSDSVATNGDNNGHSMIFVGINSEGDGAYFLEGNYDGKGRSRIRNWRWSDLVSVYGYRYGYIKYIIWPGGGNQPIPYNPQGNVDSCVSESPGTVTVAGWVFDRDEPGTSLRVHVYVGGPAGSGAQGYEILADAGGEDVNNAFGIPGNHRFYATINVSVSGSQDVYFYGLNVGGGENVLLDNGHKVVNISPKPTEFYLDLNGQLDGDYSGGLDQYGTCDYYLNGSLVASGQNDYWVPEVREGTPYEFKNISPKEGYSFDGVYSGQLKGNISGNTSVVLSFSKNNYSSITETPEKVVYNGHTYMLYNTPVTWYFAKDFCHVQGGHLVEIDDLEENAFVASLCKGKERVWLGATDFGSEGSWHWESGRTLDLTASGSLWGDGEPNNDSGFDGDYENYAELLPSTGKWNDIYGCHKSAFVLEFDWISEELNNINPSFATEYNNHLYELYDTHVSWKEAKRICEEKGGHLVTITDAGEQAAVVELMQGCASGVYYIGAEDSNQSGNWVWVTGENFAYNNWDQDGPEPSKGHAEYYADIVGRDNPPNKQIGDWLDIPCIIMSGVYGVENTGFICEYDTICEHEYSFRIAKAPNEEETGKINGICEKCGAEKSIILPKLSMEDYTYIVNTMPTCSEEGVETWTWKNTEYGECSFWNVLEKTDHSYISTLVPTTCTEKAHTLYTCSICGQSYKEFGDDEYSAWSTERPEGIPEDKIESRTEFRYSDYKTTASYDASMSGWIQKSSTWEQTESGTISYVASWPSGFYTGHGLYGEYNKNPKSAMETGTEKTVINSNGTAGYIYYHWCRGEYAYGPENRQTRKARESGYGSFHAFFSTTDPNTLTASSDGDGSRTYKNPDCCKDTYWYYPITVSRQSYTTYRKLFTYECWTDWSDWNASEITASETRKVESRTVYRYVTKASGHNFVDGICTICGTKIVRIFAENITARAGEMVTIPVRITNNSGFSGFTFEVTCGDDLVLSDITKGELLKDSESGSMTKNISNGVVTWMDSVNTTGDGVLFNIKILISEDTVSERTGIQIALRGGIEKNFVNESSESVPVSFEEGVVTIRKFVHGDVTGDGDVTIGDVVKINRHVIGKIQLTGTELLAADVTGDEDVTIADVVKVNRFVIGKISSLTPTTNSGALAGASESAEESGETFAGAGTVVQVGTVTADSGENATIPIVLSGNPGIAGMALEFTLPEGVDLQDIIAGDVLAEGVFTVNENVVSWYTSDNIFTNGLLMNLVVSADVPGTYSIAVALKDNKASNLSDENGEAVEVVFENGTLQVEKKVVPEPLTATLKVSNVSTNANASKTRTGTLKIIYDGNGELTFASSNAKITVDKNGKFTIPKNYAGTATITVKAAATEQYEAAEAVAKITVKRLANTISADDVTKTAAAKAQSFTLSVQQKGKGKLAFKSSSSSVKVADTGKVTIAKNFSGRATITITAAKAGIYNAATKEIVVTVKPATVTVGTAKNVTGQKIALTWKRAAGAGGYQIQYSTSKTFQNAKSVTVKSASTVKGNITKLTKGKPYCIRIRAFKKDAGGNLFSEWTSFKAVKVTK